MRERGICHISERDRMAIVRVASAYWGASHGAKRCNLTLGMAPSCTACHQARPRRPRQNWRKGK
jgi:hypothetical protein